MKFEQAWGGSARQLTNFLSWMGAVGEGDKPVIFGDVTTYPGTSEKDGFILINPGARYICNNEVRDLIPDLLRYGLGQPIPYFVIPQLVERDEPIIFFD